VADQTVTLAYKGKGFGMKGEGRREDRNHTYATRPSQDSGYGPGTYQFADNKF